MSHDAQSQWSDLDPVIAARLAAHGDYRRWSQALQSLPDLLVESVSLGDTISAAGRIEPELLMQLDGALRALHPWRKGPWDLFGPVGPDYLQASSI